MVAMLVVVVALGIACDGEGEATGMEFRYDDFGFHGMADPSERQLEMIADGKVTFAEYEEATLALAQCMRDTGIVFVDEPQLDPTGIYFVYRYVAGDTPAEADATRLSYQTCRDLHDVAVASMWEQQNVPSEAELTEALRAMRNCLADLGVDAPPDLATDDFSDLIPENPEGVIACIERVSAEYRTGWTR